ncbi:MAG: shikimate dehydrogenase [Pararhizobium sp.]
MAEAATRRAFVAGFPVAHSRSPLIHGTWLETYGIDGSYEAVAVSPDAFESFASRLKKPESRYCGGNITIPHKESAFRLADRLEPFAEECGAANTLWLDDGRLVAGNTDGYGFLANLDQAAPGWDGRRSVALVLGAGGASRAVVLALRDRGFSDVRVVNRTLARARELADRFGSRVSAHAFDALGEAMSGADVFVNTTSLGMEGSAVPDIDFGALAEGAAVTDIVYVPLKTPILKMAEEQGRRTIDGLGMLLHQAVPGFEKWFGVRPEVTPELRAAVIADMDAH